jgi:hypothetical protein
VSDLRGPVLLDQSLPSAPSPPPLGVTDSPPEWEPSTKESHQAIESGDGAGAILDAGTAPCVGELLVTVNDGYESLVKRHPLEITESP